MDFRSPIRPGHSKGCMMDTDHATPSAPNPVDLSRDVSRPTVAVSSGFASNPADLRPALATSISAS